MELEIILRIHDLKNIHGNKPRYINISKKNLILGCTSSLINSMNLVEDSKISLKILNDNCTTDCISKLHDILKLSKHPYEIINLEIPGFHYSGLKQFEYCKNSKSDLVYSVEDDYLHCENAIQEMLFTYEYFKSYYKFEKELCLFPFDNPEDYQRENIFSGMMLRSPKRHWRHGIWTTFTMMTTPKVFQDHWEIFENLSKNYTPWDGKSPLKNKNLVHEGNTISNIWEKYVIRVSPIPSLALHVQFEKQRDPFIDHVRWWNKYSKIRKKYC